MARPRKAQVEGASYASLVHGIEVERTGFAAYVERFQTEFPTEWEAMRLCPLVHGLEDMARLLK